MGPLVAVKLAMENMWQVDQDYVKFEGRMFIGEMHMMIERFVFAGNVWRGDSVGAYGDWRVGFSIRYIHTTQLKTFPRSSIAYTTQVKS